MEGVWQKAFQEHLGLFLFALFLSLITCFIAWYRGYFKTLGPNTAKNELRFVHVVGAFLVYFVVAMVISLIIYMVLSSSSSEKKAFMAQQINAVKAWVNLIAMSAVFISFLVYLKFLKKEIKEVVLGESGRGWSIHHLKNFGMGFLTLIICFPLVIATTQLANMVLILLQKQPQEQLAVRFLRSAFNNPVAYIFSCIFVVFIIPAIEELLFRGFLQNWLSKLLGQVGGILSASLIFAFFHFSMQQGWGNLEIIPALFVLASFAGYIYFRQKSIYASIGLHSTYNAVNVLLMTFTSSGAGS